MVQTRGSLPYTNGGSQDPIVVRLEAIEAKLGIIDTLKEDIATLTRLLKNSQKGNTSPDSRITELENQPLSEMVEEEGVHDSVEGEVRSKEKNDHLDEYKKKANKSLLESSTEIQVLQVEKSYPSATEEGLISSSQRVKGFSKKCYSPDINPSIQLPSKNNDPSALDEYRNIICFTQDLSTPTAPFPVTSELLIAWVLEVGKKVFELLIAWVGRPMKEAMWKSCDLLHEYVSLRLEDKSFSHGGCIDKIPVINASISKTLRWLNDRESKSRANDKESKSRAEFMVNQ